LRRMVWAGVAAILPIYVAGLRDAEAQNASLVGAWQSCAPIKGCLRFSFFPNGNVIKQYTRLGGTVTAHGRYRRRVDALQITWTRVSPARICGPTVSADGRSHKKCGPTAEPNLDGPLRFKGFNTLVWKISGGTQLKLFRIEQ
jgi:hypothetical protein